LAILDPDAVVAAKTGNTWDPTVHYINLASTAGSPSPGGPADATNPWYQSRGNTMTGEFGRYGSLYYNPTTGRLYASVVPEGVTDGYAPRISVFVWQVS
jgi:hypothetical protein